MTTGHFAIYRTSDGIITTAGWARTEGEVFYETDFGDGENYAYNLPYEPDPMTEMIDIGSQSIIPRPISELELQRWERVREKRKALLDRSDWRFLEDSPPFSSPAARNDWKAYRQQLRDIPQDHASDIDAAEAALDNLAANPPAD